MIQARLIDEAALVSSSPRNRAIDAFSCPGLWPLGTEASFEARASDAVVILRDAFSKPLRIMMMIPYTSKEILHVDGRRQLLRPKTFPN